LKPLEKYDLSKEPIIFHEVALKNIQLVIVFYFFIKGIKLFRRSVTRAQRKITLLSL
jgi:hypothetical protein